MEEIWKDIPDYDGKYQISNLGRVKSVKKSIIMKLGIHRDGYYKVKLHNNGKNKWFMVHRLVASAFIENTQNYRCVNHKDENKLNNNVDNLEWCSTAYNNTYGTRLERVSKSNKLSRKISQYSLDGEFIKNYNSIREAERLNNILGSGIRSCCQNKYKQSKGYIWKWGWYNDQ